MNDDVMRVRTGIIGLDELLGGGYRPNTVNIVLGSAGVGKTIFALQFLLKGLENGYKGVFVSFDMDVKNVLDLARSMGWEEVEDYVRSGKLVVGSNFHVEDIMYLNDELLNFILNHNSEDNLRIVVDSFTPLIASLSFEMRKEVNWFFSKLREVGTTVVTLEEPLNGDLNSPSITVPVFLGDSVIHMKNIGYGEAFNRTLRIVKHRGSWHAEGVFPYRILRGLGIVVEGTCYVTETRTRMDLDELLKKANVLKEELSENVLRRLGKLVESDIHLSEEELVSIVKMVVKGCYRK